MAKKRKAPRTLGEKVQALDPAFHESAMSFSRDEAATKIVDLAKYQGEMKEAESNDMDLKSKQEASKEAKKGYSEAYKAVQLKTKFLLEVITSKGG
jgi:hypothetical protein